MTDSLHRLLEVQDLDIAADQLRHRRATLPERTRLSAARAAVGELGDEVARLQADREGHLASQRKVEGEIEVLSAREASEEAKLYGGGVTALRELEALQSELGALRRRRGQLEDQVLADMESVEELGGLIAAGASDLATRKQEVDRLVEEIGTAESTIDEQLATLVADREGLVSGFEWSPADLLDTYERLRTKLGGIAVARLEGGHCLGCHLALPATEVDAVRRAPEGAFVIHEECGRILVR